MPTPRRPLTNPDPQCPRPISRRLFKRLAPHTITTRWSEWSTGSFILSSHFTNDLTTQSPKLINLRILSSRHWLTAIPRYTLLYVFIFKPQLFWSFLRGIFSQQCHVAGDVRLSVFLVALLDELLVRRYRCWAGAVEVVEGGERAINAAGWLTTVLGRMFDVTWPASRDPHWH